MLKIKFGCNYDVWVQRKIHTENTVIWSHLIPDTLKAQEAFTCQPEICLGSLTLVPEHKQTRGCKALADAYVTHKNCLAQSAGSRSHSWNGAAAFIKAIRHWMGVFCSTPVLPSGHSKLSSTSNHRLVSLHLACWISAALQARNKMDLRKKERRKEEAASLPNNIYMRKPEIQYIKFP